MSIYIDVSDPYSHYSIEDDYAGQLIAVDKKEKNMTTGNGNNSMRSPGEAYIFPSTSVSTDLLK